MALTESADINFPLIGAVTFEIAWKLPLIGIITAFFIKKNPFKYVIIFLNAFILIFFITRVIKFYDLTITLLEVFFCFTKYT